MRTHPYTACLALALLLLTSTGLLTNTASAANALVLGNAPISRMNTQDVDLLFAAAQAVLDVGEDGVGRRWENPRTGAGGTLTPVRTYTGDSGPCRDLMVENRAGGITGPAMTVSVCRAANGEWKLKAD